MLVKYKISARHSRVEIEVVTVLRETAQCVFFEGWKGANERKEAKRCEYHEYYDTWEDAHAALSRKADSRLHVARMALQDAQGFVGNVKGMRAPTAPGAEVENGN